MGLGDKTIHFYEYAIYSLLARLFFYGHLFSMKKSLLLSVLFGITDEFHQFFIPGRHCEFADILVNTAGSFAALGSLHLLLSAKNNFYK